MRFIILFLLLPAWLCSQPPEQSQMVGNCNLSGFIPAALGRWQGDIQNFLDQTNLYFATDIDIGDIIWNNLGYRWKIEAVNSANLLSANVTVLGLGSANVIAPFGNGFVSDEGNETGLSMIPSANVIGISYQLQSRVLNHNFLLIDRLSRSDTTQLVDGNVLRHWFKGSVEREDTIILGASEVLTDSPEAGLIGNTVSEVLEFILDLLPISPTTQSFSSNPGILTPEQGDIFILDGTTSSWTQQFDTSQLQAGESFYVRLAAGLLETVTLQPITGNIYQGLVPLPNIGFSNQSANLKIISDGIDLFIFD